MGGVGLGVITTLSRSLSDNLLNKISGPITLHVEADTSRRGPAFARNQCIKRLYDSGVEHFFLFDDDVYPTQSGWEDYIITSCAEAGVHVASYPDPSVATLVRTMGEMQFWQFNTGCFKYLTRQAVDRIGYFNEAYQTYGYEDIGYLCRARKAGLTGSPSEDASPTRVADFIHSIDIYGKDDPDYRPYANMSLEDKQAAIMLNTPTFREETESATTYYPYTEHHV